MSAIVISEVEILNEDAAVLYRQLAAAAIEAYGGRYLARAAEAIVAEQIPPSVLSIQRDPQIRNLSH